MKTNRFDEMTKQLAAGRSRRDLLRMMIGGAAAIAAVRVVDRVEAQGTCVFETGASCESNANCCEPYVCFEAQCDIPKGCVDPGQLCVDDFPCCDGSLCVEGVCSEAGICIGSGGQCDVVVDECCAPYTCFEGICDIPRGCVGEGDPCAIDFPCCDDAVCVSGVCTTPDDDDDDDDVGVTSLPETGSGATAGDASTWTGAALAGGAAAVVAAKILRSNNETSEQR
jgi:hypothetical protein